MTPLATPSAPPAPAPGLTVPAPPAPPAPIPTPGPEGSRRHRPPRRLVRWWRGVLHHALRSADAGMATAEYAIVTVAAAAFAGLLIAVLRSDEVRGLLVGIIRGALSV